MFFKESLDTCLIPLTYLVEWKGAIAAGLRANRINTNSNKAIIMKWYLFFILSIFLLHQIAQKS